MSDLDLRPSPEEDAAYEALETAIRAYARITQSVLPAHWALVVGGPQIDNDDPPDLWLYAARMQPLYVTHGLLLSATNSNWTDNLTDDDDEL